MKVVGINIPAMFESNFPNQTMSTATRSILILDRILSLDAQSLYILLKLIRRIAVAARLAVVCLLETPAQRRGLFHLMDNALIFSFEVGVG
jgi:hypothetical protein